MATPRDLDPKFKDEDLKSDALLRAEDEQAKKNEEDVPMIVHRQPIVVDGIATEKLHGPMPVSEWPAYEKEHGL